MNALPNFDNNGYQRMFLFVQRGEIKVRKLKLITIYVLLLI